MAAELDSVEPGPTGRRALRARLSLRNEFLLALLPTLTILLVLGLVEALSRQRLLFASLASSAFLIYLDPQHGTNSIRTLATGHIVAALAGVGTFELLGPGYVAGGGAMVVAIAVMIAVDAVHPPAVATSLSFAFRSENERSFVLFLLALLIVVLLVVIERASVWLLGRFGPVGSSG